MNDIATLKDKVLALIATATDEKGQEDVAVFTGTIRLSGERLFFDRGPDSKQFEIPSHWIGRFDPVVPEVKDILMGADYSISVSVGNLQHGTDLTGFESMGLKWPTSDE